MNIAIVNDVPLVVEVLRRILSKHSHHQIAWVAANGAEAVAQCAGCVPDLILMDILMPVMDGVEATRQIMAKTPCPILVVTASVHENAAGVFAAMGAGALDAVDTPLSTSQFSRAAALPLLNKIALLERFMAGPRPRSASPNANEPPRLLVALGASAGGPGALARVLSQMPATFPAAVVIVQHVDVQFAGALAEWLHLQSALPVRLAKDGDRPAPGQVLLAGTNDHLSFSEGRRLVYTPHPRDYVYRPSVDVLYESALQFWPGELVGVLLTGMGRDGAHGLKALRDAGCHTIAQDEASCAVYGMPKAAAQLKAASEILPLDQIAAALDRWVLRAGNGSRS